MTLNDCERELRDYALSLPETNEAFPWGERALRVRKKAFVFMRLEADRLSFGVKLPQSRRQALALPFAQPTHYGLGAHGWVTIEVRNPTRALVAQSKEWIRESYIAIAPKRVAALLNVTPAPSPRTRRARRSTNGKRT
jgi:predicted DNA-binding protein (MmcQ/YjbR family)